jgi:hypothetical protein
MKQQSDVFQEFLTEFRKLKEWSDDNPEVLEKDAESDKSIEDLCLRVANLFLDLKPEMKRRTRNIYENVGPSVISAFPDYENRYEYHVNKVVFSRFRRNIREVKQAITDPQRLKSLSTNLRKTKKLLTDPQFMKYIDTGVAGLDAFLVFNQSKKDRAEDPSVYLSKREPLYESSIFDDLSQANRWLKGEIKQPPVRNSKLPEFRFTGIDYVLEFLKLTGLDLIAARKRLAVTPDILVPEHISKKLNNQEQIALYELLEQALNAFVFGSPAAAIALLRSVVELVLSEHYGSRGRDLQELIDNAKGLPKNARSDTLHKIRRAANQMLHYSVADDGAVSAMRGEIAEKNVLSFTTVVRHLIEGSPRWSSA